jgi:hypothetical protein
MTKKCECLRKNGEKCGAYAPTGKSVCIFHDPAREADGRRARRAGGLRRSRAIAVPPSATPDHPLGNPKEVSGLLADCINQLHRGELDARVANAIGYVTGIHLRSLEQVSAEANVDSTSQLYAKRLFLPEWRREVIEGLQKKELEEKKRLGTGKPKP